MGQKIKVDHETLRRNAEQLEEAARVCRSKVRDAVSSVSSGCHWDGEDGQLFRNKLHTLDDADSTVMMTADALERYAEVLKNAADRYLNLQADAINRADSI